MRILVIEDDVPLQVQLVEWLVAEGHQAHGASDGDAAHRHLERSQTDAIIMDIFLSYDPEKLTQGALVLLNRIRRGLDTGLKVRKDAPILAISGGVSIQGGYSPLRTARDLGASAWMQKPISLADLRQWLAECELVIATQS